MNGYVTVFEMTVWPATVIDNMRRLCLNPIVIDNGSRSPHAVEWLGSLGCEVIRLGRNVGPYAFWKRGIYRREPGRFVLTDQDLDLSAVPDDAVNHLSQLLDAHPRAKKAGLSLSLDNVDCDYAGEVLEWERQFWVKDLGDCYDAAVDTTFAMHRDSRAWHRDPYGGVRAKPPYVARHRPWHRADTDDISNEYQEYLKRSVQGKWSKCLRDDV